MFIDLNSAAFADFQIGKNRKFQVRTDAGCDNGQIVSEAFARRERYPAFVKGCYAFPGLKGQIFAAEIVV